MAICPLTPQEMTHEVYQDLSVIFATGDLHPSTLSPEHRRGPLLCLRRLMGRQVCQHVDPPTSRQREVCILQYILQYILHRGKLWKAWMPLYRPTSSPRGLT